MMKHVALLQGGWSNEREVSLNSGRAVEKALLALGHNVTVIDVARDIGSVLTELKPDVVFNALHGQYGEDGTIQGLLELIGIPYTHSGVLASSVAMHKVRAKDIFKGAGLKCPEGGTYMIAEIRELLPIPFPFVVKPIADGSSVDVCIIRSHAEMGKLDALKNNQVMLVERYIPGLEIQVAVLNGTALGAIEIKPHNEFYDYEAKYSAGKADHIMPAPLNADDYAEVLQLAEKAHKSLGCRGLTRSDFRYDNVTIGQSMFYLLEINTQPGMTELSLAPEIAAHSGMDFTTLVDELLKAATTDYPKLA
jgi:D-alanine-D-alanine ligase